MSNQFGPWATPIDAGANPQLSAFWQRRLRMLAPVSQTSARLSWRSLLGLCAVAALMIILPTFRCSLAAAAEETWDRELKEAVGTSLSADIRFMTKKFAEGKQPSKPSYSFRCRIFDANGSSLVSPPMDLHEGQEGFIDDRSRTPLVPGITALGPAQGNVNQPYIVVISEGTIINLLVAGKQPNGATLDITVEQTKIEKIDTKKVGDSSHVQIPSIDIKKRRVIDFVKFGEVFTVPLGEKSATGTAPRLELVLGPYGKFMVPAAWNSTSAKPLRRPKDAVKAYERAKPAYPSK